MDDGTNEIKDLKDLSFKQKILLGVAGLLCSISFIGFFFMSFFDLYNLNLIIELLLNRFYALLILPIIGFLIPFSSGNQGVKNIIKFMIIIGVLLLIFSVTNGFNKIKINTDNAETILIKK